VEGGDASETKKRKNGGESERQDTGGGRHKQGTEDFISARGRRIERGGIGQVRTKCLNKEPA